MGFELKEDRGIIHQQIHMTKRSKSTGILDYAFGELNNNKIKHFMVYIILISIFEIMAYKIHGIYSVIASKLWLLGGLICLISIITYSLKSILSDIREKKILSVVAILALIIFLFALVGNINISEINPDAAQQAAAGLDSYHFSDLNYTGKAFLGYPNRQYLITSIPALLFGRSIATLQLGFAIPFILGILILYSGLRSWAQKLGISTLLAIIPLYALFVFPFVTEYYINFEQAIYPISFTMITAGFFLNVFSNSNLLSLTGFAWTGCLLSNSYTPALATLGLTIVLIALSIYYLKKKPEFIPFCVKTPFLVSKALMLVEINLIAFLTANLLDNRQDRITEVTNNTDIVDVSFKSMIDFLTDKNAKFMGMFGVVVLIYILAGLTLQLKKRDLLLSMWILGVFAASRILAGFTTYQPAWIMQRALLVIPVVLVGIILTVFDLVNKYKIVIKQGIIIIILLSFSFLGIYNFKQVNQSFTYFNYIQPMKYMLYDVEESLQTIGMASESKFNLILYTENILIKNPADYCKFLYPNANVYVPEYGQLPTDLDGNLITFVYSDKGIDEEIPNEKYEILTYNNVKHKMVINWYKGIVTNEHANSLAYK